MFSESLGLSLHPLIHRAHPFSELHTHFCLNDILNFQARLLTQASDFKWPGRFHAKAQPLCKIQQTQLNQNSSAIHPCLSFTPSSPTLPCLHHLPSLPHPFCSVCVALSYIVALGFASSRPIGYTLIQTSSHLNQVINVPICLPASYSFVLQIQIHFQK